MLKSIAISIMVMMQLASLVLLCMGIYIHYKTRTSYPHFLATQKNGGDAFYWSFYIAAILMSIMGAVGLYIVTNFG